jgi:hypothetical protein
LRREANEEAPQQLSQASVWMCRLVMTSTTAGLQAITLGDTSNNMACTLILFVIGLGSATIDWSDDWK